MKKRKDFSLISVIAVMIGLISVGTAAVVLPKPTVSEIEKRELAAKPQWSLSSWFSGEYAKEYDAYYADTFPARDQLVSIAGKLDAAKGVYPDDIRIHAGTVIPPQENESTQVPEVKPEETPDEKEVLEESKPPQEEIPEEENIPGNGLSGEGAGEQMGGIFLYKNMGLQIFGSSESMSKKYAGVISSYAEQLPDVQVYNIIAPTSIEFYLPEKYKKITSSQKENIEFVASQMSPQVISVDAYSKIAEHKEEYIYFRTDHHWTVRGAYQAYVAFCESAGLEATKLSQMEHRQKDGLLGTLYGQTQDPHLAKTPDFVEYFIPPVEMQTQQYWRGQANDPKDIGLFAEYVTAGPNTYSVFLHGDHPLTHIKTNNHTGRKVMLVKESYGNAFAPFLACNFDEVFIADQRYFEFGVVDFVKEKGITDLIFLNNIFAVNTGVRVNELARIQNQPYTPYVPPKPTTPVVEETPPVQEEQPQEEEQQAEQETKPKPKPKKKSEE